MGGGIHMLKIIFVHKFLILCFLFLSIFSETMCAVKYTATGFDHKLRDEVNNNHQMHTGRNNGTRQLIMRKPLRKNGATSCNVDGQLQLIQCYVVACSCNHVYLFSQGEGSCYFHSKNVVFDGVCSQSSSYPLDAQIVKLKLAINKKISKLENRISQIILLE